MTNPITIPKETKKDHVYTAVKTILGQIPVVGGAGSELFNILVTPPLEKRRQEWMEEVTKSLYELNERGSLEIEKLIENDLFIDVIMKTSSIAIRNSKLLKKEALKNALLNTVILENPDESLIQIFLNLIDNFTEWHIKILIFSKDPSPYVKENIMTSSLTNILEVAYPELKKNREFTKQIWKDLYNNGLINSDVSGLHAGLTKNGLEASRLTKMGNNFLEFIENPLDNN